MRRAEGAGGLRWGFGENLIGYPPKDMDKVENIQIQSTQIWIWKSKSRKSKSKMGVSTKNHPYQKTINSKKFQIHLCKKFAS